MRNLLIGLGIGLALGIPLGAAAWPRRIAPAPTPRTGDKVGEEPEGPAPSDAATETVPEEDEGTPAAVPKRVTWLDQEIAELRSLLGRTGRDPAEEERRQIVELAHQIRLRTGTEPWTGVHAPADLVRELLASADPRVRAGGARLASRTDPPMVAELETLYETATDSRIRVAIADGLDVAGGNERLCALLAKVVRDPAPEVQRAALGAVRRLDRSGGLGEAMREAILEATRSSDPKAHHEAIVLLGEVGAAAGERAVELLRDPEVDDRDERYAVAHALVAAGRVREVLGADPSPEWVSAIVDALELPLKEDLGGLFEPLLPRFEPRDNRAATHFFCCAAEAGDRGFVGRVVMDPKARGEMRLAALTAELIDPATADTGIAHARALLGSEEEPVFFRKRVVDTLDGLRALPDSVAADCRALLEEVSRTDPDRWVREGAARALGE